MKYSARIIPPEEPKKKVKKPMSTKFRVVNIIAVQNCGFHIKYREVLDKKECKKILEDRWGKQYAYLQPRGAKKQTTFFYNGNMINIGNTKISDAKRDLEICKNFLKKYELKKIKKEC